AGTRTSPIFTSYAVAKIGTVDRTGGCERDFRGHGEAATTNAVPNGRSIGMSGEFPLDEC
ncbi:MAG TPA: hypothetical protein VGM27_13870, partial [Acidobacteriaceae bacterium]